MITIVKFESHVNEIFLFFTYTSPLPRGAIHSYSIHSIRRQQIKLLA